MIFYRKVSRSYLKAVGALYGDTPSINIKKIKKQNGNAPIKPRRYIESKHQIALVTWMKSVGLPVIKTGNEGKRTPWAGEREKAMGLYPGASDLFLAYPTNKYPGYWIEMKSPGKKPTELQYQFLDRMCKLGYKTAWFDDWEKAKLSIEEYLSDK
jgi:hypothetical protein